MIIARDIYRKKLFFVFFAPPVHQLVFRFVYRIPETRALHAGGAARIRALLQEVPENHSGDREKKHHRGLKRFFQVPLLVSEKSQSSVDFSVTR